MNAEEPLLTPAANVQLSTTGHKLPEQAKAPVASMPRSISILNLIYQWQPMGIRVVVDLPFTSNNKDFLFCIRNGPFIPQFFTPVEANSGENPFGGKDTLPIKNTMLFFFNNTRPVIHGPTHFEKFPDKNFVHITYYDYPPILASLSSCFRRWRGDMQYRIRTIAGFATQGYVFVAPVKNAFSPIGIYDENVWSPPLQRQDTSYREVMMNSYVMGDTSMFRHVEVTVPYEYPVPYYDQYAWLSRRINPNKYNVYEGESLGRPITTEPHGDNWIVMGLRGNLAATHEGAQVMFELEYRAAEGFQFADPGLVFDRMFHPHSEAGARTEQIIPDKTLVSNGIDTVKSIATNSVLDFSKLAFVPQETQSVSLMGKIRERVYEALPRQVPVVQNSSHSEEYNNLRAEYLRNRSKIGLSWSEFYRSRTGRVTREISPDSERESRSRQRRDAEFLY